MPFWAINYFFVKNSMYWYRIEQVTGRNSIIGTTVRKPEDVPKHLTVDEKNSRILDERTYVATTVGDGCTLGATIGENAGEQALTDAYQVYKHEARSVKADCSPDTVNMDGWKATRKAWKSLFPSGVIICCFLHVCIEIRDRAKKKYCDIFENVASKLWDCYGAESKISFSQRVRRLVEWCENNYSAPVILDPVKKFRKNIAAYRVAYDHPLSHLTSNMIDRLMQRMDRHLYATQYFHGLMDAAQLSIPGWTMVKNFAHYNPRTAKEFNGWKSQAERLNQFRYYHSRLHNLYISASLGGYRIPILNPI